MRIGALSSWTALKDGEVLNFPGPGRRIVLEVMATGASVTISDGFTVYPIGVINGYERLEFATDGAIEIVAIDGGMSYRTTDQHDISHYVENDDPEFVDASFTTPFSRQDDGIDPAIKALIQRSNARQYAREAYLRGLIEDMQHERAEKRNAAADGTAAAGAGTAGAVAADAGKRAAGEPAADGVAGAEGAPKPAAEPAGDAKPAKGKQPAA